MSNSGCDTDKLTLLDLSKLKIGQSLPGDVCDKDGNVVMPAGEVLNEEHFNKLRGFEEQGVFANLNWENPPQIASGLNQDMLAEARKQRRILGEKRVRQRERHVLEIPITVAIKETIGLDEHWQSSNVVTCDLSTSGFAFAFTRYIHTGTKISMQFNSLAAKPTMFGIVRNCTLLDGGKHRVGVEFLCVIRKDMHKSDKSSHESRPVNPN